MEKHYQELAKKVRDAHETYKKYERKIINEPESESKYEKLELMKLVLNRSSEIVNWWNNYEAQIVKREKRKQEEERAKQKAINRERVTEAIEVAVNPYEQEWNKGCRYYCQDYTGIKFCSFGMDMTFCSKKCAFATNVAGSTKLSDAPTKKHIGRKKLWADRTR